MYQTYDLFKLKPDSTFYFFKLYIIILKRLNFSSADFKKSTTGSYILLLYDKSHLNVNYLTLLKDI